MEETPIERVLTNKERNLIVERDFLPHMNALLNFAYRLSYDETLAEDLVQETFLKACQSIASFQVGTNAKAWLFTILRNIFINNYRKKTKQPLSGTMDDAEKRLQHLDGATANNIDFGDETFSEMLGDEVLEALESVQDDFKTIILLDLEDFKYAEMSVILNIPAGTVRSRLHRARKTLQEKLFDYGQKMGYNKHPKKKKNEKRNTDNSKDPSKE